MLETVEVSAAAATGNTKHIVGGGVQPPARKLAIGQYSGEPGVYLFYCDAEWQVLTDTFHDSIAAAKEQAEFEYVGSTARWNRNAV